MVDEKDIQKLEKDKKQESNEKEVKIEVPKGEIHEKKAKEPKEPKKPEESKKELSEFNVGDTIAVNYKIVEGEKTRIQPFEGIVIARKGSGQSKTFTVRRIGAAAVGIERIFPLHSPNIESITVKTRGKIRRAKLYYLRDRIGKAASKVREKK